MRNLARRLVGVIAVVLIAAACTRDDDGAAQLQAFFDKRQSGQLVEASGTVVRLLSDDTRGSRHQRFIVATSTGQTLLIAHNIDLAPRVANLERGARVRFFGEYEWNNKGGVIHWTHRDPDAAHPHGWIDYRGKRYW